MKTNFNSINAFIEYNDTLEEMLDFYNNYIANSLCTENDICTYEDVYTPDSKFWKAFLKFINVTEFISINFTDIDSVYKFMKAFIDYIPTYPNVKFFIDFYRNNINFILESPERTVRYFNCIAFDKLIIESIIDVRPFLSLPINKVNLEDRKFYKLFWNSLIKTQKMKSEFYHKYPHVFLSDIDLAVCLKCSYVFYNLNSAFRNMIYHKWFQEKD